MAFRGLGIPEKNFWKIEFHKSIFEASDFDVLVFGEMAFRGLGIPEKGFRKIEFRKLTGYRSIISRGCESSTSVVFRSLLAGQLETILCGGLHLDNVAHVIGTPPVGLGLVATRTRVPSRRIEEALHRNGSANPRYLIPRVSLR